jgi:hypothetical protein
MFQTLLALAVFVAASQTEPAKPGSELLGFTLHETMDQIVSRLGAPDKVDDSGRHYTSWFYTSASDRHDSAYILVIRREDGKLVSLTRNFDPEENIDQLFPEKTSSIHYWPSSEKPQFGLRYVMPFFFPWVR